MIGSNSIRVFFEPTAERHDLALYTHVDIATGIDAEAAFAGEARPLFTE